MWERLGDIVELGRRRGVPVTCNGDGDGWTNWERIRSETSESSLRWIGLQCKKKRR
jgi:tRNA-dihydrouridine synthase 2